MLLIRPTHLKMVLFYGDREMKENTLRLLSSGDLQEALTMSDCIEALKGAFISLYQGRVDVPLRTAINMPADNGDMLVMPVYSSDISSAGVKTVMLNRDNPAKGLPFIHAMMTLFDSVTGAPTAIMDGEVITAMRTGAVSGLATSFLAREDAHIAAVIGTGRQGETQLEGVCCVRKIEKAYVFDRNREQAKAYADKMGEKLNLEIIAVNQAADAVTQADIICTATSSPVPVFDDSDVKRGAHINGIGAYRPDMAELPPQSVQRAKVVVDQKESCLAEAGDLTQPIAQGIITAEHIHGELGELVCGKISARAEEGELTIFKSVGIAGQDLAAAHLALQRATEKGVGKTISL